ncbi:hypothetical protein ACFFGF_08080 [Asaia lannensis]|uniref:Uncharacterized protein n=1 Tax=Asaia lannensis NBRC 102526 TaxID=1307926 RepID=A0ABT1CJS2_9PROT|nr:hypothetical protein [Asaia lannensis]MCO6161108.1 hypothetical protein [Asaia lannensis NBRC 102526]GBR01815.1 hypothetical protein AA102526_2629 [Asaia lannensis NBRC 102526]
MTDQIEIANEATRPEERIEQALDRIAYALHHPKVTTQPDPVDLQPLAANIEALRLRVRDLIAGLDDEEGL